MNFTAQIVASLAALSGALVIAVLAFGIAWWSGRKRLQLRDADILDAFNARFDRLENAVDGMALEIERLGEAERYTAKLLASKGEVVGPTVQPSEGRIVTPL